MIQVHTPGYRDRTRSDQRHLLVELELDDSVVLAPVRYDDGHAQHQRYTPVDTHTRDLSHRRASAAEAYEDSFDHRYPRHPSQCAAFEEDDQVFETISARGDKRPQSAKPRVSGRDNAMKNSRSQSTLYQDTATIQAHNAQKKLLSPYKLKQKVLSSRYHVDSTPDSTDRDGRRTTRNLTVKESPLALLSSSLRQNAQCRDELVAQLQQEVSSSAVGMSHQDRFSPPQLSPRLVKMLNTLRSLSLSIVEMQLYFRKEIPTSVEPPAGVAHLERELHAYLLQMISSDLDFLSCSTSLIRIFDSNGVSLVRNPFVEGLSLDSSELLLCSCNQMSSSSYSSSAFSSPCLSSPAASSSLFQLLVHKLEAFALYMRKHVPSWQVLPPERVAVALLHLIELENRANATRLLPSYLRSSSAASSSAAFSDYNRLVQASNPNFDVHRQPPSRIPFVETDDNIEKEIPVHPRSSFVAWHTVEKQHEGETNTVVERPSDTRSARRTSVAPSIEEPSTQWSAEAKQQSAARPSTKKRKGSKSEETVVAGERPVETSSPRLEKSSSHVARGEKASDAKTSGDNYHKSEAMSSLGAVEPLQSVNNIEDRSRSIEPTTPLDSDSAEVTTSNASARIAATLPGTRLNDPVSKVATELQLEQRSDQRNKPLSSCKVSAPSTVRTEAVEADVDQSEEELSAERCCRHISSPLVDSDDRSVQRVPGSIEDNVEDSRIVRDVGTSGEAPEESMFEYSSETTRSMFASALDMLPSFSVFESTESLLPTLLVTSSTSQAEPTLVKRSSNGETNPEDGTLPGVATALDELVVYDFEAVPEDEEWKVDHNPERHLASDKSDTGRTKEPVFEKIYALCRDVQVAALDMGYHLDNLVEKEHNHRSPVQSPPIVRPVPSFNEPPLYLERELKMLRRYFRPWRDFALKQTEAKRALRRRTALRQICHFVYDSHRARQFAQLELESLKQNTSTGQIQRAWAIHLFHVRVMRQKAAFRSAHMAFKRFVFYVRTSKCRRRREIAKERIHRWWRRLRDALRKQEAESARRFQLQQRRHQAAKEVQCFFRETILRQRLACVTAQKQQILFKSQLFSLKARQEEEKRRKKESKRRREVESTMQRAINDLESKWKQAEGERVRLLSHHERVLGRYHHTEEKRRRELAQLKISTFLDSCLLHRKIKRVAREKADNEVQWRRVAMEKAMLERETEQWQAKDKLQLRVLHRKLAKLENEKAALSETQRVLLETHKRRSQQLHEHVARTTIKAFIDARLLQAKSKRERIEQLRVQSEILAAKDEQERMVGEEIAERDRIARAEMEELEKLLNRAQQDVSSLTVQQKCLIAEKNSEAAAARKVIEDIVAEKNRVAISRWLSEQIRTSREKTKFQREKAELALAVELERQGRLEIEREKELVLRKREEEKRSQQVRDNLASLQKRKSHMQQQLIAQKRQREAATSTICSFVERRVQSSRRVLADQGRRLQEEKKQQYDLQRQLELQQYLVAAIVDMRFVAEKLAKVSIESAASSINRIATLLHRKHTRLQHLKRNAFTRKIQRCWQLWRIAQQRRKLEQERTIRAQAFRQKACARKIQCCWRRWQLKLLQIRLHLKELKRLERAALIRHHCCARRIQRWTKRMLAKMQYQRAAEAEQRRQAQKARQNQLERICKRASAKKIQQQWKRWRVEAEERRKAAEQVDNQCLEAELVRLTTADQMRRHTCARTIQRTWRAIVNERQKIAERLAKECREAEAARLLQGDKMRRHAFARKIQRQWRKWRMAAKERQRAAEALARRCIEVETARCARAASMRQRFCAQTIQRNWRRWRISMKECETAVKTLARQCLETETARYAQANSMRRYANSRKIQKKWRQWRITVKERHTAAVALVHQCLETEIARYVQTESLRRHASARKIQRKWRVWRIAVKERRRAAVKLASECLEAETSRLAYSESLRRRVCARKIQQQWRKWTEVCRHAEVISAELDRIHRRVCGRRILRKWREWRKKCEDIRVVNAAVLIETVWRGYYTRQQFACVKESKRHEESRLFELRLSGFARKIQLCWGQWLKRVWKVRRAAVKLQEDKLIHGAKNASTRKLIKSRQETAAVVIQSRWAGYRCRIIYVGVRKHLLEAFIHVGMTIPRHNDEASNENASPQSGVKEAQENVPVESSRTSQASRLGFRLELQQWVCHQLPAILADGISAAERLNCAAHIVQRAYRGFRSRQRLRFCIERPTGTTADKEDDLQFYFARGRAWMMTKSYSGVRLRFDSLMTRKLLLMFDPGAHTAVELQEAMEEIAADVQPIFQNAMNVLATPKYHSDAMNQDIDVDEMDLPGFCVLTRKMGRIRSMHKRSQGSPVSRASLPKLAQQECVELTIFDAVASASVEDAQFLLGQGVDLAAALDPVSGRGALHMLAFCTESYRFRLEMLEFLINRAHVSVNAMDDHGETPLMLFAVHGHLELMRKLIANGADLSITNKKGQNVLHRACEHDQVEVCGYLHEKFSLFSGSNASELVMSHGTLFLHDADPSGRYPLHILAEKGFVECAKQLIFPTEDPLQKQCCHSLLCQRDADGRSSLHLAILFGHLDIMTLLLENTSDGWIDHADRLRRSPVHLCVDSVNAVQVISLLSDRAANMIATDERGDTPLHYAALSGRVAVLQALLDCGADPSAVNNDWEIPAQVAATFGHFDCSRLLLSAQKQRDGVDQDLLSLEAELEHQQASGKSYYYKPPSPTASMIPTEGSSARCETSARVGYWEELHQEVQLVEESGNFSSEDEGFLDQDDDGEADQNDF